MEVSFLKKDSNCFVHRKLSPEPPPQTLFQLSGDCEVRDRLSSRYSLCQYPVAVRRACRPVQVFQLGEHLRKVDFVTPAPPARDIPCTRSYVACVCPELPVPSREYDGMHRMDLIPKVYPRGHLLFPES